MVLSDIMHGAVNFPLQKDTNKQIQAFPTDRKGGKFFEQASNMQQTILRYFIISRIILDGTSPFTKQQELLRFQSAKVLTANTQCRKRLRFLPSNNTWQRSAPKSCALNPLENLSPVQQLKFLFLQ